jgi:Tol biopolymer transport system component
MNNNPKTLSKSGIKSMYLAILLIGFLQACSAQPELFSSGGETWGIYRINLETGLIQTLYAVDDELSGLSIDSAGERLVFSQMLGGSGYEYSEIYTLDLLDGNLDKLTENEFWDIYPVWSPDGTQIAFLSWRGTTLDIYLMDSEGTNQTLLYDSGFHDADLDWAGDQIVFTSESKIWIMDSDGSNARVITDPPQAGQWGQANLPFGDYDPRISPDGSRMVFSRLIKDDSVHGNYDLYIMDLDGSNLTNLTNTGYTQGLSSWSTKGDKVLFIVSGMGDQGLYDLYSIKADGTENKLINPETIPPDFLIHDAKYARDDSSIYFIGQWWIESNY